MDEGPSIMREYLREFSQAGNEDTRAITEAFHKTMTALASGAIALSIAFYEKAVPVGKPAIALPMLVAAWLIFACSLLCIVIGFLLTLQNYSHLATMLGEAYAETMLKPNAEPTAVLGKIKAISFSKLPRFLSWASVAFFAAGMGLLVAFVVRNLH
jgi:hypothetical protein